MEKKDSIDTLISAVKVLAYQQLGKLGGFKLWAAKIALYYFFKLIKNFAHKFEYAKQAKVRLQKYEEIINKPEVTNEERVKADIDFLSGK